MVPRTTVWLGDQDLLPRGNLPCLQLPPCCFEELLSERTWSTSPSPPNLQMRKLQLEKGSDLPLAPSG